MLWVLLMLYIATSAAKESIPSSLLVPRNVYSPYRSKYFKEPGPSAIELDIRKAEKLQAIAKAYRQPYFISQWLMHNTEIVPLTQLFRAAVGAANGPRLEADTKLVRCWADWWDAFNPFASFDTRTDAERLIAYAVDRRAGTIQETPQLRQCEELITLEQCMSHVAYLPWTCGKSCVS